MKEIKEPELGQKVYVYDYYGDLFCDVVLMKGKDSFVVSMALSDRYGQDEPFTEKPTYEKPIRYDMRGFVWFESLEEAKTCIKENYGREECFRESKNYWSFL